MLPNLDPTGNKEKTGQLLQRIIDGKYTGSINADQSLAVKFLKQHKVKLYVVLSIVMLAAVLWLIF